MTGSCIDSPDTPFGNEPSPSPEAPGESTECHTCHLCQNVLFLTAWRMADSIRYQAKALNRLRSDFNSFRAFAQAASHRPSASSKHRLTNALNVSCSCMLSSLKCFYPIL